MLHQKTSKLDRIVTRIVLIYLLFGLFWILFSDSILVALVSSPKQFERYSIYKGVAFVGVTSLLLYLLVRRTLRQQLQIEHSLMISEERWKFALEGAGEGVWDWNLQTDEVFRSARWHAIYGYAEDEIGKTAQAGRTLMHPDDRARAVADIHAYLDHKTDLFVSEFRLRCKDGSWKWTLSRGKVVSWDADGKPLRMIGTHSDVSERKNYEDQIFQLAHYDSITGLPNRVLFMDRLHRDVEKAKRVGQTLTLMYLDLDRFKEINDTLGHDTGDLLLKEAARRLTHCIRSSDTVARLGGDEFTIILNELSDLTDIERIAQTILHALAEPFQLGSEVTYLSTSIGITICPDDATDVEVLLKNADQAMYAAKDEGRNRYNYFTASMQQAAQMRMRIANDLRSALGNRQLVVYYQPIVDMATGAIYKAEALVRWQHPTRGLVNPTEFIPIAEDTGMIVEIGDYVFIEAARQAAKWRARIADFQISVNKSPVQFKSSKHDQQLWLDHLRALGVPGDALVIEITEGLLLDARGSVIDVLRDLHVSGMQIAIDDFGTGYSSLAYLKKFDVDYVKIDRSFVSNMKPGSDDMALCEAIIVMAHKLGMQVIAEGVETAEQRDLLLAAGCDYAQGYLFSRPVTAAEFEALLNDYVSDADAA